MIDADAGEKTGEERVFQHVQTGSHYRCGSQPGTIIVTAVLYH